MEEKTVHIGLNASDLAAGILQRAAEEGRVVSIPSLGIELHPIQPVFAEKEKRADPVKSTVSFSAAAVLEEVLANGQTIEIPSLGIKIKSDMSNDQSGEPKSPVEIIRQQNPGAFIPTGAELAQMIKGRKEVER